MTVAQPPTSSSGPRQGAQGERVRVTGPARHRVQRHLGRHPEEDRRLDDLYLRSLMRTQLGLAARVLLLLAAGMGVLPALFAIDSDVFSLRMAGLPLVWLLLGVLIYLLVYLLGRYYVRRAEQNESHYIDLVRRRDERNRGRSQ